MPRLSAKEIREQIQDRLDQMEALQKVAKDDGDREFSDDEQKQWDAMQAEIGQPAADEKPADGLHLKLSRAHKFETTVDGFRAMRGDQRPPDVGRIMPVSQFRHKALRAYTGDGAEERAYKAGQFLAATLFKNDRSAEWCRDNGVVIRAELTESDNTLGGFVVPDEMESAVINLRESYGVMRREARIVPMGSDVKNIPRRTGGLTAYFAGDNDSMTASDKAWDSVGLTARKLYALCKYSSELNEDAIINIGDDLTDEIAYAFANKEDECGFNGTGTSTYGGMVGVLNAVAAGGIYTAITGNTAFSTLDLADFEAIVGKLPQYAEANAKWYISRAGYYASMARLMDAGGGNAITDLASGVRQPLFLGYPVVFTQALNATLTAQTSTKVFVFGDLRQGVAFGNRRGMSVMVSEHAYFAYDQLAIRGTERFCINVHETGSSTVPSSLIVVAFPGS
jgi:HK97 family phage major capsid protein